MICVRCSKDVRREPSIHTCWDAKKKHLVRVVAPHFVAGVVFDGEHCVEAAPILHWLRGRKWTSLARWARGKNYELDVRRLTVSYARWGEEMSDVYVYACEYYDQELCRDVVEYVCCGCICEEAAPAEPSHATPPDWRTRDRGALFNHLTAHRDAGHVVPQRAFDRLAKEMEEP